MASNLRILLGLPPSLRQSIFASERFIQNMTKGRFPPNIFQSRTFSGTQNLRVARPKPTPKSSKKPGVPTQQKPSSPPRASPLLQNPSRVPSGSQRTASLNTIAPELDKVLLYSSPSHGGFFTISYIIGATMIFGAYNHAQLALKDEPDKPKTTYWVKALGSLPALFFAIFGTTFILAPTKIIKSVAIVSANGSRMLRFEVKRAMPFMKPDILETSASRVALDRNVPGFADDLKMNNIELADVKSFTENYFSKPKQASQGGGVAGALASSNRSLLNIWPALKRDTRRMFMRDQMAYVRVEGNGKFKLDLQGCSILDRGKPLERIISTDEVSSMDTMGWLKGLFRR